MPFEYTIFPEHHLVCERVIGRIVSDELIAGTRQIWADEAYEPSFRGLVDITAADLRIKPIDVMAFAAFLTASRKAARGEVAILVREPKSTAMSVLLGSRAGMGNVSVFSTREAALEHLAIPPTVARELGLG